VPAYNLIDLFASYDLNPTWQLRAGVTNLADKDSVFVASSQTSTDTAVFDAVGRSYYLGFRMGM
jgi:outer membrane receptor protein involved in Fe transport